MSTEPTCAICGEPTDATVCRRETASLAAYLDRVVAVAGEVETSVARLACHGDRGGRDVRPAEDDRAAEGFVNRSMPVQSFGWPASKERPKRGALVATPLPYAPGTEKRAAAAINAIATWARHVVEERGLVVPLPEPMIGPTCVSAWGCAHDSCRLIHARWIGHPAARAASLLLGHLDWIRHRPEADEMVEELSAAAATLVRCVDRPPNLAYAGPCWEQLEDGLCEFELYAVEGAGSVRCGGCGVRHDVASRRTWLLRQIEDRLFTAAEAAVLLMKFEMTGDRNRCRKNIVMWAQRGLIAARGEVGGVPTYRLGDIIERAVRRVAA